MKTKHEGVGTQPHYNEFKIEPIDFIVQNGLDFMQGSVIKYTVRYPFKDGLKDLKKARQYIDWLIEREEDAEAQRDREMERLLRRTTHDEIYRVQPHEDDFEEPDAPRPILHMEVSDE